jgi:hypothetical protein
MALFHGDDELVVAVINRCSSPRATIMWPTDVVARILGLQTASVPTAWSEFGAKPTSLAIAHENTEIVRTLSADFASRNRRWLYEF